MKRISAKTHTPVHLPLCLAVFVLTLSLTGCASTPKTSKHLFILSGQSNMTGTLKDAFTDNVQQHYGEENAMVVISMRSGRGIRFWVEDYGQPPGRGLTEKKSKSNGEEYDRLITTVTAAIGDQSFDTVGFIWMQGESDGLNRLSEAYEESFWKLLYRLESDLDQKGLYFVIGRISDYGLDREQHDHWQRVRDVQVRLGQSNNGAWIDTDDLNGGNADQPNGDLHYPKEGATILGQRFAEKAIEMSSRR
jgi:hypothetical protein